MKKLSLLRFGSYIVVVGIAFLSRRQIQSIPVHLLGFDEVAILESAPERMKAAGIVVSSSGFLDTKHSGSEVSSIAAELARKEGEDLSQYLPPEVSLRVVDGKLSWSLHYFALMGPWQFIIRIDDSTGNSSYENTTAPM